MTPPEDQEKNQLAIEAMRQSSENRKEIDSIKANFEEFYREEIKFQADMKNRMDIVSKGQDHLKERFEQGTAKTLSELKRSFDEFRVEWGAKKKEDEVRDSKIEDVKGLAKSAHTKHDWIVRGVIFVVFAVILVAIIKGNLLGP